LNREAFLERIAERVITSRVIDPEALAQTVFTVVGQFLSEGVLEKIGRILPEDLRALLLPGPQLSGSPGRRG
jgi:uncharacterized protein (DUF2267 family)